MPHRPGRRDRAVRVLIAVAVLTTAAASATRAGSAPGAPKETPADTVRAARVRLTISGSRNYDGAYAARADATLCGAESYALPWRTNAFAVLFPDSDPRPLAVSSVNFDADTLRAGTSTGSFYLSVQINTPAHGTPPAFVVRAKEPQYGEHGTATLLLSGGTRHLKVVGTNDMMTLDLDVTCN